MSEWISVEEKMPNEDDIVLAYHPMNKGHGEIQVETGWSLVPSIVSHWMPLPEPPEDCTIS